MHQHHTEPTLLRVGDDNLFAISLGKDDEEFADTLRPIVALTSSVALLRAVRLRAIVIYLTESDAEQQRSAPPEQPTQPLHLYSHSPTGGVQAEDKDELELNYEENASSTIDVDTAERSSGGTRSG
eukprot:jgi/Tetstr1/420760/TSEL_011837.t1